MKAKFNLRFIDSRVHEVSKKMGDQWVKTGTIDYKQQYMDIDVLTGYCTIYELTAPEKEPSEYKFMHEVELTLDVLPAGNDGKQKFAFVSYGKVMQTAYVDLSPVTKRAKA